MVVQSLQDNRIDQACLEFVSFPFGCANAHVLTDSLTFEYLITYFNTVSSLAKRIGCLASNEESILLRISPRKYAVSALQYGWMDGWMDGFIYADPSL